MNIHSSARTSPAGRGLLVRRITEEGWSVADAAAAAGVSPRTAYKWLARFKEGGQDALRDRSSRPKRSPTAVPRDWQDLVLQLRRARMTAAAISAQIKIPKATVARILKRHGLERLKYLEPPPPVQRYEKTYPGELVHVDIKKLGRIGRVGHRIHGDRTTRVRGIGWEFVHVCIDDYTRLAYVEVLEDEKSVTAAAFLRRALAWFAEHGVKVHRVMTDNGSCFVSKLYAATLARLRLKHSRTRPYTPRTNGKAERFIQTILREWAYARPFTSSARRRAVLPAWVRRYNERRPHGGIGGAPPITRLLEAAA
jgi:transposase InsO family protein